MTSGPEQTTVLPAVTTATTPTSAEAAARPAGTGAGRRSGLRASAVSAWFGEHKVLDRV
jgi:hypothetical protein